MVIYPLMKNMYIPLCASKCLNVDTDHTNFSLLAGAGGADQSFQLIPDTLIIIQDLSQLLHKVLGLAWVWQVPFR